jgi:hypothetical protein
MATALRRDGLLAYLIGAGVAGTILLGPYTGRSVLAALSPEFVPLTYVPFFLLPVAWGLWNWLLVRRRPRFGVGMWGALLGVMLGGAVNFLLVAEGRWFEAALGLPVVLPAVYYLIWAFIIGPLNDALGVTP